VFATCAKVHVINDERVSLSNTYGIAYTIVSMTIPSNQDIPDKALAEKTATETNNWAAD
jgi:2,3-dihydroxybenzoate decarboxylase